MLLLVGAVALEPGTVSDDRPAPVAVDLGIELFEQLGLDLVVDRQTVLGGEGGASLLQQRVEPGVRELAEVASAVAVAEYRRGRRGRTRPRGPGRWRVKLPDVRPQSVVLRCRETARGLRPRSRFRRSSAASPQRTVGSVAGSGGHRRHARRVVAAGVEQPPALRQVLLALGAGAVAGTTDGVRRRSRRMRRSRGRSVRRFPVTPWVVTTSCSRSVARCRARAQARVAVGLDLGVEVDRRVQFQVAFMGTSTRFSSPTWPRTASFSAGKPNHGQKRMSASPATYCAARYAPSHAFQSARSPLM